MGIEMTQSLFIGEHTLLLEGPSDLIYLNVLSDAVDNQSGTGLDPRWVMTPAREFTETKDADIENLFAPDFYLDLVNRAYAKGLSSSITRADLNPADPRIVRQIETYFRDNGIASGKFN